MFSLHFFYRVIQFFIGSCEFTVDGCILYRALYLRGDGDYLDAEASMCRQNFL